MRDFRDLKVWEKAHVLTLGVYRVTAGFPREELYGLTNQMRRSASSIPANIAEGCGRSTNADFGRFLQIAAGSASELEYHLILSHDLGFLGDGDFHGLTGATKEVKRMLASFVVYARKDLGGIGQGIAEDSHSYDVPSIIRPVT